MQFVALRGGQMCELKALSENVHSVFPHTVEISKPEQTLTLPTQMRDATSVMHMLFRIIPVILEYGGTSHVGCDTWLCYTPILELNR